MADPIGTLIEASPDDIRDSGTEFIQTRVEGWEPAEGNLEVIALGAVAEFVAVLTQLATQTQVDIFRYFGTLAGITSRDPTTAMGESTWTMIDDAGHVIPEGTQIALTGPDGDLVGFVTTNEVTVAAGDTVTATGEVEIVSVEEGDDTSGLTGEITLIDALAFVDSATVEGVTVGGTDGETTDEYLARLAEQLALQSPRPILPDDFAVLVRTSIVGIARATALDGYNALTEATGQERCVTVGVVDEEGEPVPGPIKAEADALLQAQREVNFLTFVIDPEYTTVKVTATVTALAGFDATAVHDACVAALTAYLSPANWGLPGAAVSQSDVTWINQTTVYRFELIALLDRVAGVDRVTAVTLAEQAGSLGTADVALDGPIAMARPGTILVTVA